MAVYTLVNTTFWTNEILCKTETANRQILKFKLPYCFFFTTEISNFYDYRKMKILYMRAKEGTIPTLKI